MTLPQILPLAVVYNILSLLLIHSLCLSVFLSLIHLFSLCLSCFSLPLIHSFSLPFFISLIHSLYLPFPFFLSIIHSFSLSIFLSVWLKLRHFLAQTNRIPLISIVVCKTKFVQNQPDLRKCCEFLIRYIATAYICITNGWSPRMTSQTLPAFSEIQICFCDWVHCTGDFHQNYQ